MECIIFDRNSPYPHHVNAIDWGKIVINTFRSILLMMLALIVTDHQVMAADKCNTLQVAERNIVKMYPSFDLKEFKQTISENDKFWELTYELPDNMIGGVPI